MNLITRIFNAVARCGGSPVANRIRSVTDPEALLYPLPDFWIHSLTRRGKKMRKKRKVLICIPVVIIYFLIIPEIILRTLTPEHLVRVSDFTSLGGLLNPLLSLIIFLTLLSVALAVFTVLAVCRLYQAGRRAGSE
ncbi:hypothetical protein [Pantoea deleyi]|nr:hypothetical protein [Pantoea deleyi]